MNNTLLGIHHVTAIAGDPQQNVDFYAGILGLRMVKKTINFDDPYTYHLYYGDEVGLPGTLITFFPWSSHAHRGTKGTGQLTVFSFSVPRDAMGFWMDRLQRNHISFGDPIVRFGEEVLTAMDHDGFQFELIASQHDTRSSWENGDVPGKYAIRGFHSVTLSETNDAGTPDFLRASLGFRRSGEEENRSRFEVGGGGSGTIVDILLRPDVMPGYMGVGIVHHVAWRAPDDETQLVIREKLITNGVGVTPVIDRNYFHSIYFNEPGGVIFEVATDPPGFMVDESNDALGTSLKLPKQYESQREKIENTLPKIHLPNKALSKL